MESVLIFALATLTAFASTAYIKRIAVKYGIGVWPDKRKIHVGFIPNLGGLGIYLGGLAGLILALLWKEYYWHMFTLKYIAMLISATIILILGIFDDIKGLHARQKIIIQIIAATIVIFSGCKIEAIINPFGNPIRLGILSIPLTYLWLIGVTNAINLLDGLDGLAAGVSLIAISTFSVISYQQQDWMTFGICLAMIGGILGFLRYNYHPATIFMGDTGSLFLGFLIATLSVQGLQKSQGNISLLIPLITLMVPIGDTVLAFFRRLNRGQHPFNPDRDHLHHRLLFLGLSHRQAVHIIYLFSLFFGIAAYLMSAESKIYGVIFLIVISIIALLSLNRLGYLEAQKIKTYMGDQSIIQVKREMAPLSMRRFWHKFILIISDIIAINTAFILAYWFRFHSGLFENERILSAGFYFASGIWLVLTVSFILLFSLNGLYGLRWDVSRYDQVMRTNRVILFGALILFLITLDPEQIFSVSRLTLIFYTISLIIFLNIARLLLITLEKRLSVLEYAQHNTIIVGTSEKAKKILREIRTNPHLLYQVIGFVAEQRPKKAFSNLNYLGNYAKLPQIIRENGVEEVIIAINERSRDEILNIVAHGENMRVTFKIIPQMYDVISGHKTEEVIGHPIIKLFPEQMRPWQWLSKRIVDVGIAVFGIGLLLPLFLFLLFLQLISGIYPFLVIEDRVGKNGKIFGLLRLNTNGRNNKLSRFLSLKNIYKIPQLLNLLLGSISLVGPRAESKKTIDELRTKIKFYNRRFMVRPGITGWAQMKIPKTVSLKQYKEHFKEDLFYLENISLNFDMRILLRSIFSFLWQK